MDIVKFLTYIENELGVIYGEVQNLEAMIGYSYKQAIDDKITEIKLKINNLMHYKREGE